jgi:hypothetical protein
MATRVGCRAGADRGRHAQCRAPTGPALVPNRPSRGRRARAASLAGEGSAGGNKPWRQVTRLPLCVQRQPEFIDQPPLLGHHRRR